MEITVEVKSVIAEIQKEKSEYITEHKKNMKLFQRKLNDYAKYVARQAKKGSTERLLSAPTAPHDESETFDESIKTLRAHTGKYLTLSNHEYRDMFETVRMSKISASGVTASLNSLNY